MHDVGVMSWLYNVPGAGVALSDGCLTGSMLAVQEVNAELTAGCI